MSVVVAIFAEHNFEQLLTVSTGRDAFWYCEGIRLGASLYGAGSVGLYILPADEMRMRQFETPDEIAKMRERLPKT